MPILTCAAWDEFIRAHPDCHLLQTSAWGELKAGFGWEAVRLVQGECGAQVLFRRLPFGFTTAYLPKGPVGPGWPAFWSELDRLCRKKRAIFLKVEPDLWEPLPPDLRAQLPGFRPEGISVQPRRTLVVDLRGTEEEWLARMSKKTRACFRTAERGGVTAQHVEDVTAFYSLLEETGQRDAFGVHTLAYYRQVYERFSARGEVALILAYWQGQPLAGLMVFAHGARAYYLYAASRGEQRQLNPTYLIQLEAMRWAAQKGCLEYDLYGVPDADEETLETQFTERNDGLWGVYGYKRKFGGRLMRSAGAWERVYFPPGYAAYRWWVARRGGERG